MENRFTPSQLEPLLHASSEHQVAQNLALYYMYQLAGDRLHITTHLFKNTDHENFLEQLSQIDGLELIVSNTENGSRGMEVYAYNSVDFLLLVDFFKNGNIHFRVMANTPEKSKKYAEELKEKISFREAGENEVSFNFWTWNGRNAHLRVKNLGVPVLQDLATNYNPDIFEAVKGISQLDTPDEYGKIILWHGPPGNGKTYLIRALARLWASRLDASVEVVTDPEQFFSNPTYLNAILSDEGTNVEQLRLIILEDCASLFSSKGRSLPGFNRLLNATDGLMGQGQRVIYLLTANEKIEEIDKAVIRAGRCLQKLEVAPLHKHETREWFEANGLASDLTSQLPSEYSLADLYEFKRNYKTQRDEKKKPAFGF